MLDWRKDSISQHASFLLRCVAARVFRSLRGQIEQSWSQRWDAPLAVYFLYDTDALRDKRELPKPAKHGLLVCHSLPENSIWRKTKRQKDFSQVKPDVTWNSAGVKTTKCALRVNSDEDGHRLLPGEAVGKPGRAPRHDHVPRRTPTCTPTHTRTHTHARTFTKSRTGRETDNQG